MQRVRCISLKVELFFMDRETTMFVCILQYQQNLVGLSYLSHIKAENKENPNFRILIIAPFMPGAIPFLDCCLGKFRIWEDSMLKFSDLSLHLQAYPYKNL